MTDPTDPQPKRRGRPKKVYPKLGIQSDDPADILRALMNAESVDPSIRLRAAKELAAIEEKRNFDPFDFSRKTDPPEQI